MIPIKDNYSWPVIHLVDPPGYFTFLYIHKRNTTERVEDKKEQTNNMDLYQLQTQEG